MSEIGGITIDILRGRPQALKPRTETWEVPGIDGYGAMLLGYGDAEFEMMSVNYTGGINAAENLIDSFEELQGTVVSVTDDFGKTFDNILIEHVDTTSPGARRPMIHNGNANSVRVEVRWKCCRMAVAA